MRTCGDCNECCIHINIPGLDKPKGTACRHLKSGACGCSIYADRPSECATYTCAWLDGLLPDELRPDKSGILLERCWIEEPKRFTILAGYETRPGAIDAAGDLIQASIPADCAAIVVPFGDGDPVLFGSEDDLHYLLAFLEYCNSQGGVRHRMADGEFYQPLGGSGPAQPVQIEPMKVP